MPAARKANLTPTASPLEPADIDSAPVPLPNPNPAPAPTPSEGPSHGELEETIADQSYEIARLRQQLEEQQQLTNHERAARETEAVRAREIAKQLRAEAEKDREPALPADAPHPKFDTERPYGQHFGPTGHIGYAQMRGGRIFNYRLDHTPWPDFGT